MINNNGKRRPFRPRPQKSGFRRRNGPSSHGQNGHFNNNGNTNFNRNGSMTNPFNVEKTIQKFQQLAKDAQSSGDPVLIENYLQHADHYTRRLAELNLRTQSSSQNSNNSSKSEETKNNATSPVEKKEDVSAEIKN